MVHAPRRHRDAVHAAGGVEATHRPDRTRSRGGDGCSSARCTTRTPGRSAAWPGTPGCSARPPPSARSRDSCSRRSRARPRSDRHALMARFASRSTVPLEFPRARVGHDAPHLLLRDAHVRPRHRPHRLHGHVALDRSGRRSLRGAAHEPRASVAGRATRSSRSGRGCTTRCGRRWGDAGRAVAACQPVEIRRPAFRRRFTVAGWPTTRAAATGRRRRATLPAGSPAGRSGRERTCTACR